MAAIVKDAIAVQQPRPLTFGGLSLTANGLTVKGAPLLGDFTAALEAATWLEDKSPIWVAELLAYARTRKDWETALDALIDAERFTKRTVDQYVYIVNNVPAENRVDGLSLSHLGAVAQLPSGDQRIMLKKAKAEHLSVTELKAAVRKVRHTKILRGQASELAKAQERVALYAEQASEACRAIARDDCHKAERWIAAARRELDQCESAVETFRKAAGKTK